MKMTIMKNILLGIKLKIAMKTMYKLQMTIMQANIHLQTLHLQHKKHHKLKHRTHISLEFQLDLLSQDKICTIHNYMKQYKMKLKM